MFKILIVEDDTELCQLFSHVLEKNGYHTRMVSNGQEALDALAEEYVDLIISDIMMPVMDGYQAARAIRGSGKKDAEMIPIIAITANAFVEDKRKTMEAGMNAHLSKPLNVPELMDTIRKFCDGKQMCQRPGKE